LTEILLVLTEIFTSFDGDFVGILTSVEMSKHFDMAQKGFDGSLVGPARRWVLGFSRLYQKEKNPKPNGADSCIE
jgi:hypothetical protein